MARVAKNQTAAAPSLSGKAAKRVQVKQSDVPAYSLDDALRVVFAISNEYGKQPTRPVDVATALQVMPNSGTFKMITGAAVAYGLTDGGGQAEMIVLTDLGRRIVAPVEEGDDIAARREALLRPRVVREFLEKYDGSPLPSDVIALNVLESLDVPRERAAKTHELIVASAEKLGLLNDINGRKVVNLRASGAHLRVVPDENEEHDDDGNNEDMTASQLAPEEPKGDPATVTAIVPEKNRRVFISHGNNKMIVEQLKDMLTFGKYEPVIAVERETTSKPVPEKVMDEMRTCANGILHVGKEKTIIDADGKEHVVLNENVLIEIGAAMALFGRNFILLVEEGAKLPSNLQGLYEVRYEGATLDATATMRLLRAFNDFKS
jgi:predicted nucleotide-binding protein